MVGWHQKEGVPVGSIIHVYSCSAPEIQGSMEIGKGKLITAENDERLTDLYGEFEHRLL
jgi:hypothetical protein